MLSPDDLSHLEEIQSWLQHPITVHATLQKLVEASRLTPEKVHHAVGRLEAWIEMSLKPGDELWWYEDKVVRGDKTASR